MTEDLKPKRGKDSTRTKRQINYLEQLEAGQGKRVVIDLDGAGRGDMELLLAEGFGATQKEVVQRALKGAADRVRKKKKD